MSVSCKVGVLWIMRVDLVRAWEGEDTGAHEMFTRGIVVRLETTFRTIPAHQTGYTEYLSGTPLRRGVSREEDDRCGGCCNTSHGSVGLDAPFVIGNTGTNPTSKFRQFPSESVFIPHSQPRCGSRIILLNR